MNTDTIINNNTRKNWSKYISMMIKTDKLCTSLHERSISEQKAFDLGMEEKIKIEVEKTQNVIAELSVAKVETMILSQILMIDKIEYRMN